MEPNGDDPVVKSKTLALKYVDGRSDGKVVTSSKVWKSEEVSDEETSAGDSDEYEMAFIIKRFQKLSRKNKIFSGKSNGFKGSSSKDNTDDQNNCFNYKKLGHFRADCHDILKERSKKGGFQKDSFRNKLKKSLMAMTLSELMGCCQDELNVIIEGLVDSEEMIALGFDLQRTVSQSGWDDLFDMFYGLSYLNMIKYFWVNTSIQDLNLESVIVSAVSGVPITITPQLLLIQ
ncbi:hypothetical protein KIW84_057168 [Lathyrus oleraceus]|uniref:Uncharacterized protein n=1 Tax=Pisum sativum TaxID=3888 RepID=A0A9D4X097_PEA|nr:hypothetical protein KIW84_057168 [Pisum sativum]